MRIFFLYLLIFTPLILLAQDYSDCDEAFRVTDPSHFCSSEGFFNLTNAEPSGFGSATCFGQEDKDIWISFIAQARDATIIVEGMTSVDPKGSLSGADIALYEGDCASTISQRACASGADLTGITELYEGGLIPGTRYLIRIQSSNRDPGTFQFCMRNYNSANKPESDCINGAYICNKDPLIVQKVEGGGDNNNELSGASCGLGLEESSTWFKFVCGTSGTLEFVITPLNEVDDLDFILFELPGGLNDCANKIDIRCMAAGESVSLYPSPCHGPTGLQAGNKDTSEPPNCDDGQNNFLAPADLVAGKAYALVINNFTSTGNGFEIEWGGTATFQGPEAEVLLENSSEELCFEDEITFSLTSEDQNDPVVAWNWYLGADATPSNHSGNTPVTVSYETAGEKIITLELETEEGCITTVQKTIDLVCCNINPTLEIDGQTEIQLGERVFLSGMASLKGNQLEYFWSPQEHVDCATCSETQALPVEAESYFTLFVEDEFGCHITDSILIRVDIDYPVYAPNAFSPNRDGVNDFYTLYSSIGARYIKNIRIFDRWGNRVYEAFEIPANEEAFAWDGRYKDRFVNSGVYAYSATVEFVDGHIEELSGEIHVLR